MLEQQQVRAPRDYQDLVVEQVLDPLVELLQRELVLVLDGVYIGSMVMRVVYIAAKGLTQGFPSSTRLLV